MHRVDVKIRLTIDISFRAEFEQLAAPLFDKLRAMLRRLFEETKKKPADIESIEIIGGSSRIPMVKQIITEVCGDSFLVFFVKQYDSPLCQAVFALRSFIFGLAFFFEKKLEVKILLIRLYIFHSR